MPLYSIPRRSFGAQGDEPRPINWRRGCFASGFLFSAAWMMGWIIYLIMSGLQDGFKTPGDLRSAGRTFRAANCSVCLWRSRGPGISRVCRR